MTFDTLRLGPVAAAIRRHRLIVVLRRVAPQAALLDLVGELADAGARAFEITFDAPSAEADLDGRPQVPGRHGPTGRSWWEPGRSCAGASWRPPGGRARTSRWHRSLDVSLIDTAVSEGLPFIPGAFTPTEIATAWAAGATFVKLFPASGARDRRSPASCGGRCPRSS